MTKYARYSDYTYTTEGGQVRTVKLSDACNGDMAVEQPLLSDIPLFKETKW